MAPFPALPRSVVPIVAAALLLTACSLEEVVESIDLLSEGGTRELSETLRAPRGAPRVLVFAFDGVGHEAFRAALDEGRLSSLSATFRGRSYLAPAVTSVLPSITMAAWTSLFTGLPPAETGVPGNEWFDRRAGPTGAFRAPAPVSVGDAAHALATLSDGLLGDWIVPPTLFERAGVRAHVSNLAVHRGADLLTTGSFDDLVAALDLFSGGVVTDEAQERGVYDGLDAASAETVVEAIHHHGVPDLQVVYFPGVDLYTHVAENPPEDQQRYIAEVLDPAVASVLNAYRVGGALDGTWVVAVADHGHTEVPSAGDHAMRAHGSGSLASMLEAAGLRVREQTLGDDEGDHQAAVALQGAFAYVYLADPATCPTEGLSCAWRSPAPDSVVDRVAEALWRHSRAVGEGAGWAGAVEMILVPRRDGGGELTTVERWSRAGAIPLDEASTPPEFLRFRERLDWLLDGPRGYLAGDVIVVARSGAWVEHSARFYFSNPYRSWHSSAHTEDSRIPLLVGRTDLDSAEVADSVERLLPPDPTQLDFTRLLLGLLGRGDGNGTPGRRE